MEVLHDVGLAPRITVFHPLIRQTSRLFMRRSWNYAIQKQPGLEATFRTDPDFARLGAIVGK